MTSELRESLEKSIPQISDTKSKSIPDTRTNVLKSAGPPKPST